MPFCRVDLFGAVFELWLKSYQQVKNTIYRDHLLRANGENIHGGKHRGEKNKSQVLLIFTSSVLIFMIIFNPMVRRKEDSA